VLQFDYAGIELFISFLAKDASIPQMLNHPDYQAVCRHARLFSTEISARDIENALHELPSPFYGTNDLSTRIPRILKFLDILHEKQESWIGTINSTLGGLFSAEELDITIYPIIGYEMGIGLNNAVCLNCNFEPYLNEPEEFLFFYHS